MPDTKTQPLRVLQVLARDTLAGTEIMTATLAERLPGDEVHSTVAILDAPGPIAGRLRAAGVEVASLGAGGAARATLGLARLIRHGSFDVVCAYGLRASWVARVAARGLSSRSALICGVHGLHVTEIMDVRSMRARCALVLERLGSPLVDVYEANSEGAVELLASGGIDRGRLVHIPHGLDLDEWPDPGPRPSREAPPTVICVARFAPVKRHLDLIEAAGRVAGRGTRFRLVLIGDGPERAAIERRVTELGLGGRTEFAGSVGRDEVRRRLLEADVVSLLSQSEGMSGTVVEAMACGLAVVGTATNGIAELVEHGETGLTVAVGDVEGIADALDRLLQDPAERERMGRRGRATVEARWSLETMLAAKTALYRSVADGHRTMRGRR
jgi:glycosyltransferase involved in cell wall biosynthesis